MKHKNFQKAMQVLLQAGATGVGNDLGSINVALNSSYQHTYQEALGMIPWFFVEQATFTNATSIDTTALDPPYRKATKSLIIPAAGLGVGRISPHTSFDYIENIPAEKGVASNPNARVDKGVVIITPQSTGIFPYYRKFGDVAIDDGERNITTLGAHDALLHPAFNEVILTRAMIEQYAAQAQSADLSIQAKQNMQKAVITQTIRLEQIMAPLQRWAQIKPETTL